MEAVEDLDKTDNLCYERFCSFFNFYEAAFVFAIVLDKKFTSVGYLSFCSFYSWKVCLEGSYWLHSQLIT